MKERIEQDLAEALAVLQANGTVPSHVSPTIAVTRPRDARHGDFASNLPLRLAKSVGCAPRDMAQALIDALPASDAIREVLIAGPGFINFFQAADAQSTVVETVLSQGASFGCSQLGAGQRVQVTFVSANPSGPLPVGYGRGVVLAATMANLMEAIGFDVQREYWLKNAGHEMDILTTRVWLCYLGLLGERFDFPCNGEQDGYILVISQALLVKYGERFRHTASAVLAGVEPREAASGDEERPADALILRAQALLGAADYQRIFEQALNVVFDDIKQDLAELGVHFDKGLGGRSLEGHGKDRALVEANGQCTDFAAERACLENSLAGGVNKVLYVFGTDQQRDMARMLAACEDMGHPRGKRDFLLVSFATLFRGEPPLAMPAGSGSVATIRQLHDDVGKDATRFFYAMRRSSQPLEFDLNLAKSQSSNSPVYYVQYAYARICSVMRQLDQRGLTFEEEAGLAALARLDEAAEIELMTLLATYPELLQRAALAMEPHQLTGYLRDLANGLHSYYNAHKVTVNDDELRYARVCLLLAVRQVLGNGLSLLGVSTPEVM